MFSSSFAEEPHIDFNFISLFSVLLALSLSHTQVTLPLQCKANTVFLM